jgi:hypothetical protein
MYHVASVIRTSVCLRDIAYGQRIVRVNHLVQSERSLTGDMLVSGLKEKGTCSFIPLHSLACLHFGLLRHNHSYRSKPPYSYHHVYRCAS